MGKWTQRAKSAGKLGAIIGVGGIGLYVWNSPREAGQDTSELLNNGKEKVVEGGGVAVTFLVELGNSALGVPSTRVEDGVLVIDVHGDFPNCTSGVVFNDEAHGWAANGISNALGIDYAQALAFLEEHSGIATEVTAYPVIKIEC